jgi:hypothetical protein
LKKVVNAHVLLEEITPRKFVYVTARKLGTGYQKTELDHPSTALGNPKLAPFLRHGETPIILSGRYLYSSLDTENPQVFSAI